MRRGYLSQEGTQLDPDKDVRGNVMEGVAKKQALVDRYTRSRRTLPTRPPTEMASCRTRSKPRACGISTAKVDQAMDALRLPEGDAKVETLSGGERRRVALCKLLLDAPDVCCWTSYQPSGRRVGGMVGSDAEEYTGCVILVTHDRYLLDNVTSWILELDRGKGITQRATIPHSWACRKSGSSRIQRGAATRAPSRANAKGLRNLQGAPGQVQVARINSYEELVKNPRSSAPAPPPS